CGWVPSCRLTERTQLQELLSSPNLHDGTQPHVPSVKRCPDLRASVRQAALDHIAPCEFSCADLHAVGVSQTHLFYLVLYASFKVYLCVSCHLHGAVFMLLLFNKLLFPLTSHISYLLH